MNDNHEPTKDTADQHWNKIWNNLEEGSKWLTPEPDVERWAKSLRACSAILDLGAGVGRYNLALNSAGFDVTTLSKRVGFTVWEGTVDRGPWLMDL